MPRRKKLNPDALREVLQAAGQSEAVIKAALEANESPRQKWSMGIGSTQEPEIVIV
jgi:hypothetical protein